MICVFWIGEHILLGICVSRGGNTYYYGDVLFFWKGIYVSLVGDHNITLGVPFPGSGTNITRNMCFIGRGTHISRNMSFPAGEHISLGICVFWAGEHI